MINRKYADPLIVIIPILIVIAYGVIKKQIAQRQIEKESNITIGEVVDYQIGRGLAKNTYAYTVNNVQYTSDRYSGDSKEVQQLMHKRFYVRYYPPDPQVSCMLATHPVPAEISEAPLRGWSDIPSFKTMDIADKIERINKIKSGCELKFEDKAMVYKVFLYRVSDKMSLYGIASVGDSIIKPAGADTLILKTQDGEMFKYLFY